MAHLLQTPRPDLLLARQNRGNDITLGIWGRPTDWRPSNVFVAQGAYRHWLEEVEIEAERFPPTLGDSCQPLQMNADVPNRFFLE